MHSNVFYLQVLQLRHSRSMPGYSYIVYLYPYIKEQIETATLGMDVYSDEIYFRMCHFTSLSSNSFRLIFSTFSNGENFRHFFRQQITKRRMDGKESPKEFFVIFCFSSMTNTSSSV